MDHHLRFSVVTGLLLSMASARPPWVFPTITQNFRFVTHVTTRGADFNQSVEKWEVVAAPELACDSVLVLGDPADGKGLLFWWSKGDWGVHTESATQRYGLDLIDNAVNTSLVMSCTKVEHQTGILDFQEGPQLTSWEKGTWYVCPSVVASNPVVQLFNRDPGQPLPSTCADVLLHAICEPGPARRNDSWAPCCDEVIDGQCMEPGDIVGGFLDDGGKIVNLTVNAVEDAINSTLSNVGVVVNTTVDTAGSLVNTTVGTVGGVVNTTGGIITTTTGGILNPGGILSRFSGSLLGGKKKEREEEEELLR